MRVLVTGDREWTDYLFIYEVLRDVWRLDHDIVVTQGLAHGADLLAAKACLALNIPLEGPDQGAISMPADKAVLVQGYAADWEKLGRSAGPQRNTQMYKAFKPTLVLAFHDNLDESKGTKHMVSLAIKGQTTVWLYRHVREVKILNNRELGDPSSISSTTRAVPIPTRERKPT